MELTESTLRGTARIGTQGRYVLVNQNFHETFGYQSGELVGSDWKSIIHPKGIGAAIRAYEEMQTHGIGEFHGLALNKDGASHSTRILLVKDYRRNSAFSGHFCFVLSPVEPLRRELGILEGDSIFQAALEDSPVGGVLVDPSAGFRRVNRTLSDMLGYAKAELLGKNFGDITHPESFEKSAALACLVIKGALPAYRLRKRILRKNGEAFWCELSVNVARDTSAGVIYALGLIQKLSGVERIQGFGRTQSTDTGPRTAPKAVELMKPSVPASQPIHRLLRALNSLPHPIAILRLPERRYVFASQGFLRLCGRPPEEIIGVTDSELRFFVETQLLDQLLSEVNSSGRVSDERCSFRTQSGEERPVLLTAAIIEIDGIEHMLMAIQDVTEHKRTEKLLRDSEDRYHAVAEQAWEGILLVDATSKKILEATRSFLQLIGYDRTEIFRFTLYDLIAREQDAVDGDVDNILAGQLYSVGERPFRRKDGQVIDLEVSANTVYYGGTLALRVVVRDVSERRRLEEQLRHAVKMEALGRFAGGIAHDFNNLLVGVLGYSTLLEAKLRENEPLHRMAREITSVAIRARELTSQLLSISRRQVLTAELLGLNAIVKAAEMLLRRIIGEDIELICELDAEVGQVRANAGQIEQVIMNLAANSRDAMPAGGRLVIRTANVHVDYAKATRTPGLVMGHYVLLSVQDTGCGMDSSTLSHIFEPFFTTKASGVGTGLGLSTVYGIVKQLGGYITVDSQLAQGTTFNIYLPRAEEHGSLFQPAESKSLPLPAAPTVLVVEDEKTVRSLVEEILTDKGYQVLTAEKPERALLLAREHEGPVHLFITDIVMPGMLGTHLAAELLRLRPNARVLYMSGYSDSEIVKRTQLGESAFFLQKPFTPEEILRKVRSVLNIGPDDQDLERG